MREFGRWAARSVLVAGFVAAIGLAPGAGARASARSPDARATRRSVAPTLAPSFFFVRAGADGPATGAALRACTAAVTASLNGDGLAFAANGPGAADSAVRMAFDGAGTLTWRTQDRLAATMSSFRGRESSAWRPGRPLDGAAVARGESGVEVRVAGDGGAPAYSLRVPPGLPREAIGLRFQGASGTSVDAEGRLLVSVRGGRWTHSAPRAWQETAGGRRPVACRFVAGVGATARLACGPCDPAATLVIDPTVTFARTYGEPNRDEYWRNHVSVDAQGGLAYAFQASDPTPRPYYGQHLTTDLLVVRLSATGQTLLWSASLGDHCYPDAIVARDSGAVLVAGTTDDGANFPHVYSAFSTGGGYIDAFVAQLASGGASLEFSTVYGGTGNADPDLYDPNAIQGYDMVRGACVDSDGGIVVVGESQSTGAPLVGQFGRDTVDTNDGFVFRLSADGHTAIHAGYFGGSGIDAINAVCPGPNGSVYIAGTTASSDLPVKDSVVGLSGAGGEAFVARLSSAGELEWGTKIGGSGSEAGNVVAAAPDGSVYVGGWSTSSDLPLSGPGPYGVGGSGDLFVMHIDPATRALLKSVRIGGSRGEEFTAAARDSSERLWLTGDTTSSDFPLSNALSSNAGASVNQSFVPFLVVLDSGCGLLSSGYLGGSAYGMGTDVAADGAGAAWLAGQTYSTDFPSVNPGQGLEAGSAYLMAATFVPHRPDPVTAQVLSESAVKVTWAHDGKDVDHFEVQSRVVGSPTFATLGLPAADARTFTGGNDHPLETVAYRVRAWISDLASPWSDEATVTLPAAPPAAPTGLAVAKAADGRLHLTWTDASDDETSFEISRAPAGSAPATIASLPWDTTEWDDDRPLPDRGAVEYRVRAVTSTGASGWAGPVASSTPATLTVDLVRGRIHLGKTARKSSVHLSGIVRRIDDSVFEPQTAGLEIRLGGWQGAEILNIPGTATAWKFHHKTWTWSSPHRTTPRAHVVYVPKSGRLVVSLSRMLPPALESGPLATSIGNSVDGGSDTSEWRRRHGSLRLH